MSDPVLLTAVAIALALAVIGVAAVLVPRLTTIKLGGFGVSLDAQIDDIRNRLPSPDAQVEEKQYALLREYHAQGLAQSKISFWFSLIFAAIGFAVIVVGIFMVNVKAGLTSQSQALISIISGSIIDAVSALFFVQSNRARQLMIDFFDKLRVDRKLDEALGLVKVMDAGDMRTRIQAVLALNFADVGELGNLLPAVLGGSIPFAATTGVDGVARADTNDPSLRLEPLAKKVRPKT